MLFTPILLTSALALSASALPYNSLSKRQTINCNSDPSACPGNGPSGIVQSPAGGFAVTQTSLPYGGDGAIPFNYTTVYLNNPDAFTQNVNISLQANNQYYHLAALTSPYPGADIEASLITPPGACGTFNLVVQEQQLYDGQPIIFKAAAPQITINCVAYSPSSATTIVPTTQVNTLTTDRLTTVSPPPTTQSILTGVTRSSQSILTGVTRSLPTTLVETITGTPLQPTLTGQNN